MAKKPRTKKQPTAEVVEEVVLHSAESIAEHMKNNGMQVTHEEGEVNIVYLTDGRDARRVVFVYADGEAKILHDCSVINGSDLMRVHAGQYDCWSVGYHNDAVNGLLHPALVQVSSVLVDRIGEFPVASKAGIDHCGMPTSVRNFFGRNPAKIITGSWIKHMEFMQLVKLDARYMKNNQHRFNVAFIPKNSIL